MHQAPPETAAIALGSNIGDRRAHIAAAFDALDALPDTRVLARGPIIETPALTAPGLDPGGPYLNSAALLSTRLTPRDLLARMHTIERALGRTREGETRWAARTIDLDLIAYAERTIDEPGLTLPHPRAHERTFVLEPLAAIAPDLTIPGRGRVADLLARVKVPGTHAPQSPFLPALLVAAILFVLNTTSNVLAQPLAQATSPPTPAEVLLELQTFYRTNPTCERIQFELRVPAPSPANGTRASRSSISVQLQPTLSSENPGTPATPAALALELGALRVFASAGQLTAIHARDAASFYQSSIDAALSPAAISAALPPILIPELDLLAAPVDAPVAAFAPYATAIAWTSVEVDPKHPSKRTIRGSCTGGGTSGGITLVEQNHRLRSIAIDLPAKRTTLTLTISSFGPCEPLKASIDTARRTRVDAMDELRPRSGTLRVGVRLPSMPITQGMAGPDKGNWDMGALLQPPLAAAAAGVKPAEHVVLIFLRTKPLAPPLGDRRFNPDALAALLKRMHDDAFRVRIPGTPEPEKDPAAAIARFGFAPVLVMNAPEPDEILRRLKDAGDKWPDVLWSTDARATIDLFNPGADAVAVILDAEYVLRAVIPIDQAQTAEQVNDQITASLFELGAGEAK